MTMKSFTLLFIGCQLLLIHDAVAWHVSPATRKEVLLKFGSATCGLLTTSPFAATAVPPKPEPKYITERASADKPLSPCNGQPVKKNCWSTEDTGGRRLTPWVPPPELAKQGPEAVLRDLEETIQEYPQSGQSSVDGGGWKEAQRSSKDGVTYIRYEFTSLKFKYVDDLEIRVDADGKVCTRSASREGGFDYNVNATRLNYIGSALKKKGWQVKRIF